GGTKIAGSGTGASLTSGAGGAGAGGTGSVAATTGAPRRAASARTLPRSAGGCHTGTSRSTSDGLRPAVLAEASDSNATGAAWGGGIGAAGTSTRCGDGRVGGAAGRAIGGFFAL